MDICKTKEQHRLLITLLLGIILFLFLMYAVPKIISSKNKLGALVKYLHSSCLFECEESICKNMYNNGRSSGYYINDKGPAPTKYVEYADKMKKYQNSCLFSVWALSHMLLYVVIGLIIPEHYVIAITVGVLFEIFEHIAWNCGDVLDVLWNTIGFCIGAYINKQIMCKGG